MVATAAAQPEAAHGVQPFDPRLHLRPVASLVAEVFASELDANGRTALQEMETIGRWSPVLGSLLSTAFFADFVSGYVWLEHGQIVGNVTLQRQEDSGTRWRISNVAVAEPFRGRGIARLLMLASLREIARRGGSWAMLQVRVDNPPARHLYERLGFANVCHNGLWHAPRLPAELPQPDPAIALRPLGAADWHARYELAQASRPALAHWAEPVYATDFQTGLAGALRATVGELTGLQRLRRWGVWSGDVLQGEVEVVARGLGRNHRVALAVRPDAPEGAIPSLLAQGLGALRRAAPLAVLAEYNGELVRPGQILESIGFRPRRVLLTMRRLITPADADMQIPGLD